jgi:branched-chain amino acid transport system permease protein
MKWCIPYLAILLMVILLATVVLVIPSYYVSLLTLVLIFGIFSMSLDILLGYSGLASLGHAVFFGVSAYLVAVLNVKVFQHGGPFEFAIELSSALIGSLLVAAVLGLIVLHTRGIYFLMLTMALSMLLWGLVYKWRAVTGGSDGIYGITRPVHPWDLSSGISFYYFVLVLFTMAALCMYFIVTSSFGRALKGINQNELRMRALGFNVWIYLYAAYLFSGLFAGLSGALFAYYNYFAAPVNFHLVTSAEAMLMVIIGGAGTLFGPLIGAGVIIFLKDIISSFSDRWIMILGFLYILVIIFIPNGVYGALKRMIGRNV